MRNFKFDRDNYIDFIKMATYEDDNFYEIIIIGTRVNGRINYDGDTNIPSIFNSLGDYLGIDSKELIRNLISNYKFIFYGIHNVALFS